MATTVASTSAGTSAKQNPKQMQALVDGLNTMRQEQRQLSNKLVDIESDMNEHRLVIEALKNVADDRRCFRMVGGVLIEQKVKDVIPDLEKNYDLIQKTVETYDARIKEKGSQITEYVKTNNLVGLLRGAEAAATPVPAVAAPESSDSPAKAGTGSVLV